jgi:hypothetical protein
MGNRTSRHFQVSDCLLLWRWDWRNYRSGNSNSKY